MWLAQANQPKHCTTSSPEPRLLAADGEEELAKAVNMSSAQLNRKLGALIDQPASHLIRSMRLQRAADLLQQNAGNVAEIAYQVGFNDQAHFARSFKKQFGCAPSEFRRR